MLSLCLGLGECPVAVVKGFREALAPNGGALPTPVAAAAPEVDSFRCELFAAGGAAHEVPSKPILTIREAWQAPSLPV
jgi:hypothetical protein